MTDEPAPVLSDRYVLIVDDEPFHLRLVHKIVSNLGYNHILTANSGVTALQVIDKDTTRRAVELVITDWDMPDMSGLQLLNELRLNRSRFELPIIMMTAHKSGDVVSEAVRQGADCVIFKPFSGATLKEKISIARSREHTPEPNQ
ncbi:MAG: response regulator [Rhodospirillaceae bacterium]|nr:MAG: response regulator [Rhodospirillaceae bacterium]